METEISNPQSAIRNPQSHIFLLGFMASGKSTVGPVLAAKLHRPFSDLDRLIEAQVGSTIAELIAREGEERFRRIETEMLQSVEQLTPLVIAPGGGAVTRMENHELMLRHGITVWLDAPFDLCWRRIQRDGVVRPLALNEEAARAHYQQRAPLYRSAAVRMEIREAQSAEEIAEKIIGAFLT